MGTLARIFGINLALLATAAASAHVFWIQPAMFRVEPEQSVAINLRVGDQFPGDAIPRDQQRIVRFLEAGPGAAEPKNIGGRDGRTPAGNLRLSEPGTHILGYQSKPTPVTLEGPKFEMYLREKGLEKISQRRASRGQTESTAHEIYSRCAKTVLVVGQPSGEAFKRDLGMRYELIALNDPTSLRAGETLKVLAKFEGKPLANAMVSARCAGAPESTVHLRTDEQGEVTIKVAAEGMWVVESVEMVEAPMDSGAQWESLWASFCFQTAGAPNPDAGANPAPAPGAQPSERGRP